MDSNIRKTITNLVEIALQTKKVIASGQYPTEAFGDVIILDEMCNAIIENYTKVKDNV